MVPYFYSDYIYTTDKICSATESFATLVRSYVTTTWTFCNIGSHKAAISANGVIVDSSARTAFALKEGKTKHLAKGVWKIEDTQLYFTGMSCTNAFLA